MNFLESICEHYDIEDHKAENFEEEGNILEEKMLDLPQIELQTINHFGPGIYIREVLIPAGIFVIGHHHKKAHMNMLMKGVMNLKYGPLVEFQIFEAPYMFTAPPGRKILQAIEDVSFFNIYPNPTNERDNAILEKTLVDKTKVYEDKKGHLETIITSGASFLIDESEKVDVSLVGLV